MDYNNVIIIGADRNGSTAFQNDIRKLNMNQDHYVWLGECFSQDETKNQPPEWWDPVTYPPEKLIKIINLGTGKSVFLKIQITWPNFNDNYFKILAKRRIFYHRNLFDSSLSRCIAKITGRWFTFEHETEINIQPITIPEEYFRDMLEYRLERYNEYLEKSLNWCNECKRYENYKYTKKVYTLPNPNKKDVVINYNKLKDIYNSYTDIDYIEKIINKKIDETKLVYFKPLGT